MVSLKKLVRSSFIVCLIPLIYAVFSISRLKHNGYYSMVQEGEEKPALSGLTPLRQDLLNSDVAIIVCYRDRKIQLDIFINFMNSFLLHQNSSARIYIIEQYGKDLFNRAKLFNVGYIEAKKDYNYSCFIFHDVDLLPQNSELMYHCDERPLHFAAYMDKFSYRLPYASYFGGVSALTNQHMEKVNGFSNSYWGWGGEDDDIYRRVRKNFKIKRPPANLTRYTMLRFTGKHTQSHAKGRKRANNYHLLQNATINMANDGLNSINYEVVKNVDHKTHIWILADLKYNVTDPVR